MNKALLDTDIYSEILRGVNATVTAHARTYRQAHGRLTLSVITVMEMVKGLQKVQRPQKIATLLTHVGSEEVLEFGQPAAETAGRIWGDLERTGQPIGLADPMIAAIALVHGLELVTGNTAHYQRIQQLGYPLTLVNWRIPQRRPKSPVRQATHAFLAFLADVGRERKGATHFLAPRKRGWALSCLDHRPIDWLTAAPASNLDRGGMASDRGGMASDRVSSYVETQSDAANLRDQINIATGGRASSLNGRVIAARW